MNNSIEPGSARFFGRHKERKVVWADPALNQVKAVTFLFICLKRTSSIAQHTVLGLNKIFKVHY
jgi:hypothetical protein